MRKILNQNQRSCFKHVVSHNILETTRTTCKNNLMEDDAMGALSSSDYGVHAAIRYDNVHLQAASVMTIATKRRTAATMYANTSPMSLGRSLSVEAPTTHPARNQNISSLSSMPRIISQSFDKKQERASYKWRRVQN